MRRAVGEQAGGLAGAPINVVQAKTVDLMVPAESEIVIEGFIDTEWLEPEAPFGESHGHVNLQEFNAFMEVTAITRRKRPILTSFISQVTPSESSVIRKVAMEPVFLNHLRAGMGIKGVKRVAMHEPLTSLYAVIAVQFERGVPVIVNGDICSIADMARALEARSALEGEARAVPEHAHAADVADGRDLLEAGPRHARRAEAQVDRAPVDRHQRACGCLARISSRFATAAGGSAYSTPFARIAGRSFTSAATRRGACAASTTAGSSMPAEGAWMSRPTAAPRRRCNDSPPRLTRRRSGAASYGHGWEKASRMRCPRPWRSLWFLASTRMSPSA